MKEWIGENMNYYVKPLKPEHAGTFTDYLGNLDFHHAPHWSTCFCRYYFSNCSFEEWVEKTGEANKKEALNEIKNGNMKGFLAFDGDTCIGWCNANDSRKFLRLENYLEPIIGGKKVGCIICYVVHPEYRNQGVARLLLKEAVKNFEQEGYDAVLALPVDNKEEPEKAYRGTLNMYLEHGFKEIEREENRSVMLLKLKN
ncbi:MAG: hypothetical protein K0S47_1269 [Herbinix sp.]|jgi:GNAT superfamily N-acetyltransferase|nr:hypothetical protein [Herbinix sp.]